MASALDTFCGQSYGAKQYHMLGIHLQSALIVMLLNDLSLIAYTSWNSWEVWSFEMMVLLSGLLPNPKLETSVLTISTRASNELGAGRPRAAYLAVCVAVAMVATEGILAGIVMILGHKVWGYFYSKDEQVVKYVGEMLLLIAASHFVDGIQSVLTGE
ncbi:hypothetical protein SCA6_011260 [Theobroma cacao]